MNGVINGINGSIFAYGQTSSGKTHTMIGTREQPGILALSAAEIFRRIANTLDREFIVRASFVEIYNERTFDLLSDSIEPPSVAIREDVRRGVYCDTTEIPCVSYEHIMKVLGKGINRRHVAETQMNEQSSRSHSIFR